MHLTAKLADARADAAVPHLLTTAKRQRERQDLGVQRRFSGALRAELVSSLHFCILVPPMVEAAQSNLVSEKTWITPAPSRKPLAATVGRPNNNKDEYEKIFGINVHRFSCPTNWRTLWRFA